MNATLETQRFDHFVKAQAPVWAQVLAELRAGRKRTHWMWFVFPQLAALGRSGTAKFYGLAGLDEARAYLAHPLLGPRLKACTEIVTALPVLSAHEIFGSPDDLKLRSCLTLFERASDGIDNPFHQGLARFYAGTPDEATLALLSG